jgi:hypothetical protein
MLKCVMCYQCWLRKWMAKEGLNAQVVDNALYGLQKMSSDHDEVRDVLSALAMKVLSC